MSILDKIKETLSPSRKEEGGAAGSKESGESRRVLSDRPNTADTKSAKEDEIFMQKQNPLGEKEETREQRRKETGPDHG